MTQNISGFFTVSLISLTCSLSFGGAAKLTREQIKHFDGVFAEQEKAACQAQAPLQRESWLMVELKKVGEIAPKAQTLVHEGWKTEPVELKVDGNSENAFWFPGSPGTFGVIDGKPLKFSNDKDGRDLSASVTAVGKGTLNDLKAVTDLENKIWLVEKSESIPDLWALALEAKAHHCLGLLVYDKTKNPVSTSEEIPKTIAAMPIFGISGDLALNIKNKLKTTQVQVTLTAKTDFPFTEIGHALFVKKGPRDAQVFIVVAQDECLGVGESLASLQWINTSQIPAQGTSFVFVNPKSFADSKLVQEWGNPAAQISIAAAGESNPDRSKFLNTWFKLDSSPDDTLDVKPALKKAAAINSALKGLISGESLKKYSESLKALAKPAKSNSKSKLVQVFGQEDILDEASQLRVLKQAHAMAEKGQWDEASKTLKHLSDFQWAENVSPGTFLEYEKLKGSSGSSTLDPAIWVELQKGKQNVDVLLEVLEKEIDRLDKKLSDNFFKLQKSIEEFSKI